MGFLKTNILSQFKAFSPINTNKAPQPVGPYSQAIQVSDLKKCKMIFFSGQIPLDPESSQVVGDNITEQSHQVFKNIEALLESQKINFSHIAKTMVFLTDMKEFSSFNKVYAEYFKDHKPARSCVEVSQLPKGVKVEVEVIAFL